MIHRANADFWDDVKALSPDLRARADKLKSNPQHPCLAIQETWRPEGARNSVGARHAEASRPGREAAGRISPVTDLWPGGIAVARGDMMASARRRSAPAGKNALQGGFIRARSFAPCGDQAQSERLSNGRRLRSVRQARHAACGRGLRHLEKPLKSGNPVQRPVSGRGTLRAQS